MRGAGQIAALAALARPDVGVITAIAPVHLELLGSIENIARAKAELLEALPPGGVAIIPATRRSSSRSCPQASTVRRFEPADVSRCTTAARTYATRARGRLLLRRPPPGARTPPRRSPSLEVLGLPLPAGDRRRVVLALARRRRRELPGGGLLINDAWNANPVAMAAALAHLRDRAAGRRTVAVLGEMAELGDDAPRFHAEVGRDAQTIDVVIGVGELARDYAPDEWVATRRRGGRRSRASSSGRATSCSSRARARWGSRSSQAHLPESPRNDPRPRSPRSSR